MRCNRLDGDSLEESALRALARARPMAFRCLPSEWSDTLGVTTLGEVCDQLDRFVRDARVIAESLGQKEEVTAEDLTQVYHGNTGVPSLRTAENYVVTTTQHVRDILRTLAESN